MIIRYIQLSILVLGLMSGQYSSAQRQNSVLIDGELLSYEHFSSFKRVLPNYPLQLVIVDSLTPNLMDDYAKELLNKKATEKWNCIILELPKNINASKKLSVLEEFLDEVYYDYFFDRNRVHVFVETDFNCKPIDNIDDYLAAYASIWLTKSSLTTYTGESKNAYELRTEFLISKLIKGKSSKSFDLTTVSNMPKLKQKRQNLNSFSEVRKKSFFTFTGGYYRIFDSNKVSIDEEIFVNLTDFTTLWNLNYNYMLTEKFGLSADLGFTLRQEVDRNTLDNLSGTQISAEGSGGAILKFGVGAKYIFYKTKRAHVFSELLMGSLSANVVGGSGGATITDIGIFTSPQESETERQQTNFLQFRVGANYRLTKLIFFNANIHSIISSFDENIGGASGFSGLGINLGIGFVF